MAKLKPCTEAQASPGFLECIYKGSRPWSQFKTWESSKKHSQVKAMALANPKNNEYLGVIVYAKAVLESGKSSIVYMYWGSRLKKFRQGLPYK